MIICVAMRLFVLQCDYMCCNAIICVVMRLYVLQYDYMCYNMILLLC